MRRISTVLATLAAASLLALTVPVSAHAAQGTLLVNDVAHEDPSGCYDSDLLPMSVTNHTDAVAIVYSEAGCTGEATELVHPGESTVSEVGRSVHID
ncbi:hypothetical protein QFZ63_000201 [Streptomyces sp. B3I7]|uniref:hypothetical protein n=1 Tax=Streptomyces sp. B3I7 TaxID=3042269 RepID=UPI002780875B|nr:hypothetical protein [Streptomyces sp. B3I7]MDQ0808487.1 hypothetical protein [Streptomyces sp. B3I7]